MTIETDGKKKTSVVEKLRNVFCSSKKVRHPRKIESIVDPEGEEYIESSGCPRDYNI